MNFTFTTSPNSTGWDVFFLTWPTGRRSKAYKPPWSDWGSPPGNGAVWGMKMGMTDFSFPETNISIHITYITWKVGGIEDESSCWRWFFLSELRAVMIQGGYEYNMRSSCMFDLLMGLLWQQDWNGYKESSLLLNQIQHHNHTRLGTSGILHLLAIVIGDQWLIIAAEETACENDVKLNLNLNEC